MKNASHLLSIIIPSLEVDLELDRCISSIELACGEQKSQCEVILVLPHDQIKLAKQKFPSINTFTPESRRGIYAAMNDGIRASNSKYLYFIGKDDILLPSFSEIINKTLTKKSAHIVTFDVFWGRSGIYSGQPSKWKILTRNLCHQGVIYSRELLLEHGPYLRKMKVQADHLLNIRALWDKSISKKIVYHHGAYAWYSAGGYSSTAKDDLFWKLYPLILKKTVGNTAYLAIKAYRFFSKRLK